MKIHKHDLQAQLPRNLSKSPSSNTVAARTTAQGPSGTTDKVELSGWNKAMAGLRELTRSIPAVNDDKVAGIKQAIDSGTYVTDGKTVARSILKSQLMDQMV